LRAKRWSNWRSGSRPGLREFPANGQARRGSGCAKTDALFSALAGIELSQWDMEFRSLGKFNAEFKVPKIGRSLPSLAATTLSAPVSVLCGHAGQERCTML
jgi:hypothetical protein